MLKYIKYSSLRTRPSIVHFKSLHCNVLQMFRCLQDFIDSLFWESRITSSALLFIYLIRSQLAFCLFITLGNTIYTLLGKFPRALREYLGFFILVLVTSYGCFRDCDLFWTIHYLNLPIKSEYFKFGLSAGQYIGQRHFIGQIKFKLQPIGMRHFEFGQTASDIFL